MLGFTVCSSELAHLKTTALLSHGLIRKHNNGGDHADSIRAHVLASLLWNLRRRASSSARANAEVQSQHLALDVLAELFWPKWKSSALWHRRDKRRLRLTEHTFRIHMVLTQKAQLVCEMGKLLLKQRCSFVLWLVWPSAEQQCD